MPALRRRDPFLLGDLREEMDRLFEEFFQELPTLGRWEPLARGAFPALNTWEDENNLYLEAELPGIAREDLEISLARDELTIKGERRLPEPAEGMTFHRRERATGPFSRTIRLPVEVQDQKVDASLKAGVLTISLPKAERSRTRTIKVEATD